ncbi:MAG: hypothetical protein GKC53_05840 [Neisseriaceae bacterium]|nr:MAG: hypothetical protein GKC53_05840 [Neisseriaceae bacterium]
MFIESIKIQNGQILLEDLHLKRIQNTQLETYGFIYIKNLQINVPATFQDSTVKCRLYYHQSITKIEFEIYQPKLIRNLKLVEDSNIDYHLKYANRSYLNNLKEKNSNYSDIIITQNGYLTDTSYTNIILYDGYHYLTPDTYLLNGIQRQYLLANGLVQEQKIHRNTLQNFQTLFLINTMLSWHNKIPVPISNIDY